MSKRTGVWWGGAGGAHRRSGHALTPPTQTLSVMVPAPSEEASVELASWRRWKLHGCQKGVGRSVTSPTQAQPEPRGHAPRHTHGPVAYPCPAPSHHVARHRLARTARTAPTHTPYPHQYDAPGLGRVEANRPLSHLPLLDVWRVATGGFSRRWGADRVGGGALLRVVLTRGQPGGGVGGCVRGVQK